MFITSYPGRDECEEVGCLAAEDAGGETQVVHTDSEAGQQQAAVVELAPPPQPQPAQPHLTDISVLNNSAEQNLRDI